MNAQATPSKLRLQRVNDALRRAYRLRPLRFLAIGALNTAVGYLIFYVAFVVTRHSFVALACAMILGVLLNFFSTGRLVFGSRDETLLHRFVAVYGVVFAANLIALHVLERLGVGSALAQAILTLPLAALSYCLNRDLVFDANRKTRDAA